MCVENSLKFTKKFIETKNPQNLFREFEDFFSRNFLTNFKKFSTHEGSISDFLYPYPTHLDNSLALQRVHPDWHPAPLAAPPPQLAIVPVPPGPHTIVIRHAEGLGVPGPAGHVYDAVPQQAFHQFGSGRKICIPLNITQNKLKINHFYVY